MKKFLIGIGIFIFVVLLGSSMFFSLTPAGKRIWNNWVHDVQVADDTTNYETLKDVEDTCRAMISSYNADKLIYEQYKDSAVAEEKSWANNAKIRANQTASTYNNYILQNKYVWKDNVPEDIYITLEYIA